MATASSIGSILRNPTDHVLIGEAAGLPTSPSTLVLSASPLVLPYPGRIVDLQLRISFPPTGRNLPIILFSHGGGFSNHLSSLNGFAPLANFWASHGFVVIQPTHLASKSLSLPATGPGAPLFWRSRVEDMKFILDRLDDIEALVPTLKGRTDRSRVVAAGHSMGGHTASLLLGATLTDPDSGEVYSGYEPRFAVGLLLAAPGNGGSDLSDFAYENLTFFRHPSFAEMKTKTLVVVGDKDDSPYLTKRGADWRADSYRHRPGPKDLLTLVGGEHWLGGISGYDAAEATDESPERVAVVQRMTVAWLRSALGDGDAWGEACKALEGLKELATVESK
ncbi:platelet-activating factor acetylhydrolase plasma/intracellular [Stipitochalara longipes BDJ]|nr:platelet-activating factor acetylhydrolase plasma/intracellular [Stipitochalara longipes BDJ]